VENRGVGRLSRVTNLETLYGVSPRSSSLADNVRPFFTDVKAMPDAALVASAREGHAWALEALFRRHVPEAINHAFRILPSDDPEDLAQEAIEFALTHLDRLQRPQAFGYWLKGVIVKMSLARLRRRAMLKRLGLYSDTPIDPDGLLDGVPVEDRMAVRELYEGIAELEPEERVALVLHHVEGHELKDVAEQLELSLATVKRRIAAALERLQKRHGGRHV
jgi:RNA polymerase sigma-70 factor (ECF subfamily)